MRVNIASAHRFHLLDLARELSEQGIDVKFYSYVPDKRCQSFGLPKECCASFLWVVAPFFVLIKIFGYREIIVKYRNIVMDYYMSWFMRPCDVYIALGTVYKQSLPAAKRRFGAKTILEWGSMHIDDQRRILAECNVKLQDMYFNKRSKEGYQLADYIAIPAEHTRKSFIAHGIPEQKLLVNPYGVDVSMFHPIKQEKSYDVIMVGNWSRQKGCDLIVDAIRQTGLKFLHVGGLSDVPFPENDKNFTHVDPVNQPMLINYLNQAKVFLMPTRQDGFGMVFSQALACNLPIIGSPNSGAVDLKSKVLYPEYIYIIKDWTPSSVAETLTKAISEYSTLGDKIYAGDALSEMTWEAYGKKYAQNVRAIVGGGKYYDLIMVGGWSRRKGADLIVDAILQTGLRFLHVGAIVDFPFPDSPQFTHVDPVDQPSLLQYYNLAKIFLLPSREEGLSMVQVQALACNLPIIGSMNSGAYDLKQRVEDPRFITLIKDWTVSAVVDAINETISFYPQLKGKKYAGTALEDLTWQAYGQRYAKNLHNIMKS